MASAAARTWRRSCVPIAPSKATQSPSGAARSRSRIRPRSQRFVAANRMVGGRLRGASEAGGAAVVRAAARGEATPRTRRAGVASWRSRAAEDRPDVHEGVGPVARPVGRDRVIGDVLERRCRKGDGISGDDPPEHATDIDVDRADGRAEREGSDRARRVRPDPRERLEFRHGRWDTTAMLIDHDPGRPPQRQGPPVVTETLPRPKDGRGGGCGERLHRGELLHEPLPVRRRARRLGLLGHRLGDEDRVRVASPPERERPALLRVPGEDRVPGLWRDARRGGHATRIAGVKRRLMAR